MGQPSARVLALARGVGRDGVDHGNGGMPSPLRVGLARQQVPAPFLQRPVRREQAGGTSGNGSPGLSWVGLMLADVA
jgi:hypothetical protein